jgi:hyperosmotically inducible protein
MKPTYPLALLFVVATVLAMEVPLRASNLDDRIEASAKKTHVFQTYLKGDAIKTESKNGVVTLTGTVANASHKSMAQDTMEGLPGVTRVDNQLTVKAGSPPAGSDGWLSLKVESALLFHRNVNCQGTDVSVKDGIVRLRGEASNVAQKELTGEYAKDVEGVKQVKNEMTISKTPVKPDETAMEKIDDASITAQVKASLMWHQSTSAVKTKVETTEGVVTVSGVAASDSEKSLVTKLASDINGVTRVINNITIGITPEPKN